MLYIYVVQSQSISKQEGWLLKNLLQYWPARSSSFITMLFWFVAGDVTTETTFFNSRERMANVRERMANVREGNNVIGGSVDFSTDRAQVFDFGPSDTQTTSWQLFLLLRKNKKFPESAYRFPIRVTS